MCAINCAATMRRALRPHGDAIHLDSKLFARIQALHDQRAGLKLDAEGLR